MSRNRCQLLATFHRIPLFIKLHEQAALRVFIYLFIGRESKRTYMTDGVKRNERSMQYTDIYERKRVRSGPQISRESALRVFQY